MKTINVVLVLVIVGGWLTSCSTLVNYPVIPEPPFDVEANRYATMQGSASVEGSGFLRQRGGGVVNCAGSEVWLVPDTPYFRWLITPRSTSIIDAPRNHYPIPERLLSVDPEYFRVTECDADGYFAFTGVPAGSYIAITLVEWRIGEGFDSSWQGGYVAESVTVHGDEPASVAIDTNIRYFGAGAADS